MAKFLHTSDWQLGMTRRFLGTEAQARYLDDQIESIRRLARITSDNDCAFVVVAGDIFESLQPDRRIVTRVIDALSEFTVPVYLVPGNHDADSPSALWSTSNILSQLNEMVHFVRDASPISVAGTDVEIIAAPWPSRRPDRDLIEEAIANLLPPNSGVYRVVVGHGVVDVLNPDPDNQAAIKTGHLEEAISSGSLHYVALGDRHTCTSIGKTGAIWYSGAPLMTSVNEILEDTNRALIVDLGDVPPSVTPVEVGGWRFLRAEISASGEELVANVREFLDSQPNKERTVIRLTLEGTVNLSESDALERVLDLAGDLFASVTISPTRTDLAVVTDESDFTRLDLSGFGHEALAEIVGAASPEQGDNADASHALRLLYRLVVNAR